MVAPFRCALLVSMASLLAAAEHHGVVTFGGVPVPGATVTATEADQKLAVITDPQGAYSFRDLRDGTWLLKVEMAGFAPLMQDVTVAPGGAATLWDLKLLPFNEIVRQAPEVAKPQAANPVSVQPAATSTNPAPARNLKAAVPAATALRGFELTEVNAAPAESAAAAAIPSNSNAPDQSDLAQRASDGFLINGSQLNGNSSPFGQNGAFGNNRRGPASLYNGSLGFIFDNSTLDARPFSLAGQDTPKAAYSNIQGVATLGGVFKVPHVIRNGPIFFVAYQWARNRNASTQSALVPTGAQRNGDLIVPQARALLNFYPLPNVAGSTRYNYQAALPNISNRDALQSRLNKTLNNRNTVYGSFAFQRIATSNPTLFGFLDTGNTLGLNASANWQHRFGQRMFAHFQVQYSRQSVRSTPYFANRENVSAAAGIFGNDQDPANWGPPTLVFSSGILGLSDVQNSFNRNQTTAWSFDDSWNRGRHNIAFGMDLRRQEFNYLTQQNPRGTFTFTGAATGSDLSDFLQGIPDTSSLAFGNADKYFRQSVWDAFVNDDWRIGPALTLNVGARWEYGAPITELYRRLVNLDIAPGFSAVAPVTASDPTGSLTGMHYTDSLVHPDKHGIEPRIGLAWRPFPASSMIVRAGYGIYYNTSVYQSIALQMAQQSPLSRSLSVQNTAANPLTLANGFNVSPNITTDSFAIDPNFRVGYSQNWQVSVQRDLPGSLVATATYLGIKGTRGMQEFLPNTYPTGAASPCAACPSGFIYLTSNGNSTRESGQLQLRRRLHSGLTASLQYTYSKSIDDSALGGRNQGAYVIAQNWLDLSAERGLSTFDQRHLLNLQIQYSTGTGLGGGTLLSGWRGALYKQWTVTSQISAGSGLPLTPVYLAAVNGTGITGSIRPDYTGAALYSAPSGLFLNPAAYAVPAPGQWGDAGRDSITGPSQFSLNASLGRTFRISDRFNLDLRVDSTNALNHVVYSSWNTTVTSAQFGLPTSANAMRSLQTTLRLRF